MIKHFTQILILAVSIAVVVLAAFFTTTVELPPWSHVVSTAGLVLIAIPCVWTLRMWLGTRDAMIVFAALGVYAVSIELCATLTGFPYGRFSHSELLAYKIFGEVPWTVAIAYPLLFLAAYSLAANFFRRHVTRIACTAIALVLFDLAIDPAFVSIGFWSYETPGPYYAVPTENFFGWILTSVVAAILYEFLIARIQPLLPTPPKLASSGILILVFVSTVAIFTGLVIPAMLGLMMIAGLVITWAIYDYEFDDKIVIVNDANQPVATASKLQAHNSETRLHRAFSVFIFNSRGEVLLQQRAFAKKTWPGIWSNSCCGHLMLHESIEHAAARRLKKELGLNVSELATALPDFRYRAEKDGVVEHEICPVLVGLMDGEPNPDPSEVADVRWMRWDKFLEWADDSDSGLTPWAIEEVRQLESSDVFQKWFSSRFAPSDATVAVC